MATIPTTPRGRNYVRVKMAQVGGTPDQPGIFVERWGLQAERIQKAAVAALTSGDMGTPEAAEFFGVVRQKSVIGGLVGLRRVDFKTRMLARTNGATGFWVGEANPTPMLKPTLNGSTLTPLRVGAIIASTAESVRAAGPVVEAGLQADLETGCVGALDAAFLDPANAGITDVSPAAVTHGAATVAATGDPVADLKALIEAFDGDMSSAYLVTDPDTATALAMAQNSAGVFLFPDCGSRGGSVLGIPLLVSRQSPRDSSGGQIALIDPSGIAVAADGIQLDLAKNATLVMADSPTSPAEQVSLFQTNTVAWRCMIRANWEVQRAGGVAVLTGVQ